MLIALLLGALLAASSGAPGDFFLTPDLKKEIKRNVADPERKAALLTLSKNTGRSIKAYAKFNKRYLKEVPAQFANREASRAEIEELLEASYAERKNLQGQLVEATVQFQDLCTREEWDEIVDVALEPSEKQQHKLDKAEAKALASDEKPLQAIRKVIESEIGDEKRRAKALIGFGAFESQMTDLQDHIRNLDPKHEEKLREYGVSTQELSALYAEQNQMREEVYAAFLDMHVALQENTTDEEWKSISRAVKKIFK